ncbi:MAG TPA: SET domain-containing protein-lysine N-methyltransferase [Candidatus Paceibacterota bacterium]
MTVISYVVRPRSGIGDGLFATRKFRKGEFVIEYTGERISSSHADTLSSRYLFEVDSKWTIDANEVHNTGRFVNHSCEPNCEAEIEDGRVLFYALRTIEEGEELTIDYGEEYFDEFIRPTGCKCDAVKHR